MGAAILAQGSNSAAGVVDVAAYLDGVLSLKLGRIHVIASIGRGQVWQSVLP